MPPVAVSPSVSVVILGTRRRELERCLEALRAARPPRPREVFVVLNGGSELSLGDLLPWRERLPLEVIAMPAATLGRARNAAVRLARGEVLVFLDDDARVPEGFFEALSAKLAQYPAAAVLGGPNLTPPGSGRFQRWVGSVLSSRMGAGPMRRRYAGFARDTWTDDSGLMLCNLAVRRGVLEAEGLAFPETLDRNEENSLLDSLRRRGRLALHAPDLAVLHERRGGPASFLRQCALSGLGRGQMTRAVPRSLGWAHVAPLGLGLAAAAAASRSFPAAAFILAAYAAAALSAGWRSGGGALDRAAVTGLIPAAHGAYAAGFLAGLAGLRVR